MTERDASINRPGTAPVVIGVDRSDRSRAALQWALRTAAGKGVDVDVVHCWTPPDPAATAVEVSALRQTSDQVIRAQVEEAMAQVIPTLRTAGLPAPKVIESSVPGHPATVLIERSLAADLLVLGTRGATVTDDRVFGQLAVSCLTHARCVIAVVDRDGMVETYKGARRQLPR